MCNYKLHIASGGPRPEPLATVSTMTGWSDIGRSDDLPELAPEATAALARVLGAIASVDTEGPRSDPVVRRWTEQFVTDVASLDDDLRVAVAGALGADLFTYVVAVWADDMAGRLRSAWAQLAGSTPSSGRGVAEPETDTWPAVEQFLVAVSRLDHLDAVTTQGSYASGVRGQQLPPVPFAAPACAIGSASGRVDVRRDRPVRVERPRQPLKVALRVTDAVLWSPPRGPRASGRLRRCFSPDQAVELVFDVVRNAASTSPSRSAPTKTHVADGVEYFGRGRRGPHLRASGANEERDMSYEVDFVDVSTVGLESSPVADALAGLRASRPTTSRTSTTTSSPWRPPPGQGRRRPGGHPEGGRTSSSPHGRWRPDIEVENIRWTYVFYEDGLSINVLYPSDPASGPSASSSPRAWDPEELGEFKFARQKSKLAGTIRGSYFKIKASTGTVRRMQLRSPLHAGRTARVWGIISDITRMGSSSRGGRSRVARRRHRTALGAATTDA